MIARRQFDQTKKGKLRTSVVRECLVALTGSSRAARILDQFLYWAERVNDVDRYIQEEKARCEQTGGTFDAPLTHGWIYKAAVELIDEIMLDESEQTVRKDITLLVEWGYLSQRSNPTHKWDRTIQYRVNLLKIQEDLQEIGYALEGYPLLRENQGNLQNGESKRGIRESKRESGGAIPEHTVETTLEHKENIFHAARGAEQQSLLDEETSQSQNGKPQGKKGEEPKTTRPRKASNPNTQPILKAYQEAYEEHTGFAYTFPGADSKAAKTLADAGYTPEQVTIAYKHLCQDEWWSTKNNISLLNVCAEIGGILKKLGYGRNSGAQEQQPIRFLTADNLYT